MKVWSFDPGVTSGWILVDDNVIESFGEFAFPSDQSLQVLDRLGVGDTILYESLHCSPGFNPAGFEVIGAIKYACYRQKVSMVIAQAPQLMVGPSKWPDMEQFKHIVRSPHVLDAIYHYAAWAKRVPMIRGGGS